MDNRYLQKIIPIADAIAEMFGRRCEVVLHDLTRPQSSVAYTKNGHVTGRKIGQSFHHLFPKVLSSSRFKNDHLSNYKTVSDDGRVIKSSTALIRDDSGMVIGAFCVNFDVDDLLKSRQFAEEFVSMEEAENPKEEKEIVDSVWDVVTNLIRYAVQEYPGSVHEMSKNDKLKIVSFLNDKGLFLIKGAIDELATALNVSKVTIYGYLDELKSSDEEVSAVKV
ncbi:MAG TPA: PAS domain-containing protein [Dictyobacter sp.]|jgi:predicted transcriptional regulator YheO|nr:PAS domain-containing protein [Dictyobacter sp.]